MSIDLSSFAKALASFERGIARARSAPGDEELRDAVIQRFEFTYELAWKSLRKVLLDEAASHTEIEGLSFKDLIRAGAEKGLIDDPTAWFVFREERNISTHAYDADKAAEVYLAALDFASVAKELHRRLVGRI